MKKMNLMFTKITIKQFLTYHLWYLEHPQSINCKLNSQSLSSIIVLNSISLSSQANIYKLLCFIFMWLLSRGILAVYNYS